MAIKKYVKFDSEKGYLDNKDDINYFATHQLRKVAFGKMLGDFDENGLYVINQKIVEELLKMPKVIVEMVEEADLIRSKVKADTFFHFILTIENNKASLKLLEKIYYQSNKDFNSGVYSNINEYVLDEVKVLDKDFDRNALYQKYNISTENDGEVLSIFDMDELSIALYYNIIEKLKVNYLVQNELMLKEKQIEKIEADYFEAMLGILAEFEDFGNKVATGVKKDLAEKHTFVISSKPFFQKTVNEVLDSHIDLYTPELSPEQKEQFLSKQRDAKANYYQQFKTIIPMEISKKAGVRFDANQVVDKEVLGDLAQQVTTKGYTSSDVRKIIINEDEKQLSIVNIKKMVHDNEEMCNRDNTKSQEITQGREHTTKFYEELKKEEQVDVTNDETLIQSAIAGNSILKEEKSTVSTKEEKSSKPLDTKAPEKKAEKKGDKKAEKKADKKEEKKADKKETAKNTEEKKKTATESFRMEHIAGSSSGGDESKKVENEKDNILDDILGTEIHADNYRSFDKKTNNEKIINTEIHADNRRTKDINKEDTNNENIISIR